MMKCIDTHIHIWNFQKAYYAWLDGNESLLNRNYLIEELAVQRNEAGITEGVLVQAANTEIETAYMLEVAENNDWIKGVVGWLPLMQPEKVAQILNSGYATHPKFKGVRHLIHDEPDTRWLLQPPVVQSLKLLAEANLPYDVVGVLPDHLQTVLELCKQVPHLKLVLDHINQPPIKSGEKFGVWGDLMIQVAKHSNVHAKMSGLGTTTGKGNDWSVDDIKPYVEFVIQHFGSDRCFCGGDWPVSLLAGSYKQAWQVYRQTLQVLLSNQEMENVFYSNGRNFYQL